MSEQMRMLAMNNPAIARMLDEQERQKQYQQRVAPTNYGGGAMGNFLTAASGAQKSLGEGAQAVAGNLMGQEKPMGMNEKMAVQADQMRKAEEAKKSADRQKAIDYVNSSSIPTKEKARLIRAAAQGQEPLDVMERVDDYTPAISLKEAGALAKDFTAGSVKEYIQTQDVSKLEERTGKKGASNNYVMTQVQTGVDRNGQPIFKQFLVDKKQVAGLTDSSAVVDIADLTGVSLLDSSDSQASPEGLKVDEDETKVVSELGGVRGMTAIQATETRKKVEDDAAGILELVKRLQDPNASSVLGRGKIVNRVVSGLLETEDSVNSRYFDIEALQGAIKAAKLLGVNPTDKDFEKSLASRPNLNDGKDVWDDWLYTRALPALKRDILASYGKDEKRANEIVTMLDHLVKENKSNKKPEVFKTSSGIEYTIEEL